MSMTIVISIFAFLLGITVLIGVHEFGHYWVARRYGVIILRFSIGFGKALFSWKRNGTRYCLGMIPLGGYVQMLDGSNEDLSTLDPELRARAFDRQPLPARAAIVAAGPAFNFILALILYMVIHMVGQQDLKPIVYRVLPDSPAAMAGVIPGDEVLAINDEAIKGWRQLLFQLLREGVNYSEHSTLLLRSPEGTERTVLMDISKADVLNQENPDMERAIGIYPWQPSAIIQSIAPNSPFADSGLRAGDRITRMDDQSIATWHDFVAVTRERPNRSVKIIIDRDGVKQEFDVVLGVRSEGEGRIGYAGVIPMIDPDDVAKYRIVIRETLLMAIWRATVSVYDMSALTLTVLKAMVKGEASLSNISGPFTIAHYAGTTFLLGLVPYLTLMALLSLSIGIINLLPIPTLDGGHLLYYFIELLKGTPVSKSMQLWGLRLGLVIIAGITTIALYNDFHHLLG